MRDRRFGVELEFDSCGLGRDGVRRVLREALGSRFHTWDRVGYDGSELELRSPILRGKEGFKELELVMNTLSDKCDVSDEDGMHVHHDAPEFVNNVDNCIKLVSSWYNNRNIIYNFVDPLRSDIHYWACPKWSIDDVRHFRRHREVPDWDRKDLNLHALSEHGSIEFRLHEGTLDFSEAESWIRFGQRFIDRCLTRKTTIKYSKSPDKLLKGIRVAKGAEKVLLDKAARRKELEAMRFEQHKARLAGYPCHCELCEARR